MYITRDYLRSNPNHMFVFGDNLLRKGKDGASALRGEPNTYSFVTKKAPNNRDESFYRPDEYRAVFLKELQKLEMAIRQGGNILWLISALGSGLANKYGIWEQVIKPELEKLHERHENVRMLF